MKKTVKVGVLTGLILAPAAVVSANDGTQNEPIVTVATTNPGAGVVPYNTVAALNIEKERIEELFKLDGKTTISNFNTYQELVNRLFPQATFSAENTLLSAKLTFLKELQDLKARSVSLTNEISLLKTTNPQLFTTVPDLVKERAAIAQSFEEIRKKLDDVVLTTSTYTTDGNSNYSFINNFESQAMQAVDSYLKTIQGFETEFLKNVKTLETYAQDIIKSNAFIYGGTIQTTNTSGDAITITIPPFVEDIKDVTTLQDETQAQSFIELLNEANQFYNEKMNANEKRIADSHVLADGQTVAAVMKQANDDLTKANKVAELITGIQSVTSTDYKSKVGRIVSEYEKLNVRAKQLVFDYEKKVANQANKSGYKDGLDFIALVDALKPNATQEYRKALEDAMTAYGELGGSLSAILASYNDKLIKYSEDVIAVVAVEDLITGLTTNSNVTETHIEDARKAYNALTSAQKKIVDNYKELQAWEKSGKTTIKLSDQIDAVIIENKKTFATKVDALNKSFNKLSANEQSLVTSSPRLTYLTPFAKATGIFYSLKTTSPSYKKDVEDLYTALTATTGELVDSLNATSITPEDKTALQKLKDDLTTSVTALQNQLASADKAIVAIEAAKAEAVKVEQLKLIQTAREAYNGLPKEEQKLVTNLKTLTELEKVVKQPLAVIKAITAADPENVSRFPSTAKSAFTAFEKLTATQKSYLSDDDKNLVEDFKTYLAFVDQMKTLKPSTAGFQEAYDEAKEKYDTLTVKPTTVWKSPSDKMDKIIEAVKTYESTFSKYNGLLEDGADVNEMIDKLTSHIGKDSFLTAIDEIEAKYASLSADAKKQVTNYKQFQQVKKDGVAGFKVIDLLNDKAIVTVNVADSNYVKKVESAIKAYDKLTSNQKAYVYNRSNLDVNLPIYEVVKAINNLKPSAKTYNEDVVAVREMYSRLTPADQIYLEPILYKIEGAETGLVTVNEVMDLIDAARPGIEDYVQKLIAAREAYDKLARINSAYQKLVLNYKTLTEREKALKPVTTAVYQIKELEEILARPIINSNELVKKYNDAVKAYEKIPYESRELVYNREVLLSTLYPVAKTTEAIASIKPSSNTFAEDVKKAREWYDSLSDSDKARVSNYRDLVALENTVSGGSDVDSLIRQIPSTSPTQYMQAIKDARAAYNALSANEKRAVVLYKELQNYEKGVKNVQAAIDAIDNLQYASNLISAYDKATKALDKLTAEERQMVPNMSNLRSVGPAIDIYKMIDSLKPSNANYTGTVQAAYSAYNRLSSTEKQYVTNFATLQEAKNNIDSVQAVISKISGISPTSRNYAEQVADALAMYNSLPSAVRKLVTNYDVLKSSQKDADMVSKVRQLISEINPNDSNFEAKVKSARSAYDRLTTQQKRLVSNYFLLEDYEAQLNTSIFFF